MNLTEKYLATDDRQRLGNMMSSLKGELENMLKLVEGYVDNIPAPIQAVEIGQEAETPQPQHPPNPAPSTLAFYCFGSFRLLQDDCPTNNWNGHKGQLILKYLVAQAGKPVSKEKLMEAMWPEADPEAARRNLHQAIYSLRHTLKANNPELHYVLFKNEFYLLNPEVEVWIDFVEFEKHVQQGRTLESKQDMPAAMEEYALAEGLFQGEFMQDNPYEEWAELKRNQLQNLYLEIADKLGNYYFAQQQYRAAIFQCQRLLERDNCHEPAYRVLMQCYLNQGQRHMVVRQYQACVQALKETLGLPPSDATRLVYRQLIFP